MMKSKTIGCLAALMVMAMFCAGADAAEQKKAGEENWYRAESPMLAVYTGFIYEPHPGNPATRQSRDYTIQEWAENLGSEMDADQWVADFKEAGANYLMIYDKWIDGFVFHDTKTTNFKTKRDFVKEIVDACHRGGLRIGFYYNAMTDGNPEYEEWALKDSAGNPVVFSSFWPTHSQTVLSPFRKHSVEQARELLTNYGRIDGIWLDIFHEHIDGNNKWFAQGYEKMYGEPVSKATGARWEEFRVRIMAEYLDEVKAIGEKNQPDLVWTANGWAAINFQSGLRAKWVGSRLDYGSDEGHSFHRNEHLARMAWVSDMPVDVGLLLNQVWFVTKDKPAQPASVTRPGAIAVAAVTVCQGASLFMALTPGHSGKFGEDLDRAKAIGGWFKKVEHTLKGAQPFADVGVILGAVAKDGPGFAGGNTFWKRPFLGQPWGTIDQAFYVKHALEQNGAFGRVLLATERGGSWPDSLDGYRAVILPERAQLDEAHADRLREYVKRGGRLIAFGYASTRDAMGVSRPQYALADLFGARHKGELSFAKLKKETATVKTDSVYAPEPLVYSAENLLDGFSSSWASDETPMPHWAEITLGEAVEVAKVQVVNRAGAYQIKDLDVELHDGKDWKLVKSVRDTADRTITVELPAPTSTDKIRVKILRELYQGQERQLADIEAIRVIDAAGRNHALNKYVPAPLTGLAPELQAAFKGLDIKFPSMALDLELTTAKPLATLGQNGAPAILRNRHGKGEAILIATSEGAFSADDPLWIGLRRLIVGEPTLTCDGQARARYRLILTEVNGTRVLHVIDRQAGATGYQEVAPGFANAGRGISPNAPEFKPGELTVTLDAKHLGNPKNITLVGEPTPLDVQRKDGRIILTLTPNPVATVEFR